MESDGELDRDLVNEEQEIKEALRNLPFEQLVKLRKNEGNASTTGGRHKPESEAERLMERSRQIKKARKSKHAPLERSAKIPVSRRRKVIEPKKKKGRDPRFDDLSGKFNPLSFEKAYGFLADKKKTEIETIDKALRQRRRKRLNQEEARKLKVIRGGLSEELKKHERLKAENEVRREIKVANKEREEKGQLPFYPKKSEVRKRVMQREFQTLEKEGRLDTMMKQKRRRLANTKLKKFRAISRMSRRRREARESSGGAS
eukprot:TRINITY_DN10773_c0_g1_i3.p1 TRINITY_DN10773_c0_g1~~TRINITY_DN10773_c0_g1_i3.p1  ORF type:complete len:259 (-),score=85.13 TRINITY_DN10773_c0_g1_i3:437-1213(-)